MKRATKIGLFSGILMIIMFLLIIEITNDMASHWFKLVFAFYFGSVVFAQYKLHRETPVAKLKELFGEGFKVFIVITLLMVLFTWTYLKFDTVLQIADIEILRKEMASDGNRTPDQINQAISDTLGKKNLIINLATAILRYLVTGTIASLMGGIFFSSRNKR